MIGFMCISSWDVVIIQSIRNASSSSLNSGGVALCHYLITFLLAKPSADQCTGDHKFYTRWWFQFYTTTNTERASPTDASSDRRKELWPENDERFNVAKLVDNLSENAHAQAERWRIGRVAKRKRESFAITDNKNEAISRLSYSYSWQRFMIPRQP